MELVNSTRMVAGYTMGMEPSGREYLIVVIKGTFAIPEQQGAPVRLHEEQEPLLMSDVFYGEPGLSAPKYEADFALRKRRCDLLLNASAYAPDGRPAAIVEVSAQIGNWLKAFNVVGDRVWETAGAGIGSSPPIAFVNMEISYDRAYGGSDTTHEDPAKHAAFLQNPTGRGFHSELAKEPLHGSPLPNTEELGRRVNWINGDFKPMSFGPIGRHWEPRARFAGTYDKAWIDNDFPFLPADFDEQYYQSAPIDQQLLLPSADQLVTLKNLTKEGKTSFILPYLNAPVHIFPANGGREDLTARNDTILIEPDEGRVTMTWRVSRALKKNMFEISQVLVGKKGRDWWQQRDRVEFPIRVVVEPMKASANS